MQMHEIKLDSSQGVAAPNQLLLAPTILHLHNRDLSLCFRFDGITKPTRFALLAIELRNGRISHGISTHVTTPLKSSTRKNGTSGGKNQIISPYCWS